MFNIIFTTFNKKIVKNAIFRVLAGTSTKLKFRVYGPNAGWSSMRPFYLQNYLISSKSGGLVQ